MFIHGNSPQKDFIQFFNILESEISESLLAVSKPIFGTDDETVMRMGSSALFCTSHLRDNCGRALTWLTTVQTQRHIIKTIFGPTGLTTTTNQVVFDERRNDILQNI